MKVTMNWTELVNSYDDDNQTFERYFCDQLGINPDGCFVETSEGLITTDEAFEMIDKMYKNKNFIVVPMNDTIRWNGHLNSDYRIAVIGGWTNAASAANGKKGGRQRKKN